MKNVESLSSTELGDAITSRARVRIGERAGHAQGLEGQLMGYSTKYHYVKVGFLDSEGEYTGESTVVNIRFTELVEDER